MKRGKSPRTTIREFAAAHAEGLHGELAREFCPECEAGR